MGRQTEQENAAAVKAVPPLWYYPTGTRGGGCDVELGVDGSGRLMTGRGLMRYKRGAGKKKK